MENDRFKITNNTGYGIGFTRPSRVEENIQPGRFVYMTRDEILYESHCIEKWLRTGELSCDSDAIYELFKVDKSEALVSAPDDEIMQKLKQPLKAMTTWLNSLTDEVLIRRVFNVACDMDSLPVKKIEAIDAKANASIMDVRKLKGVDADDKSE